MPSLTNIFAYDSAEKAAEAANDFLNSGWEVAIVGPTSVVRLMNDKGNVDFWSAGDTNDIIVLVATRDGLDKLPSLP